MRGLGAAGQIVENAEHTHFHCLTDARRQQTQKTVEKSSCSGHAPQCPLLVHETGPRA